MKLVRRIFKVTLLLLLAAGTAIVIWNHFDSRAMPRTVDFARAIVGDRAMLATESVFYSAKNRYDLYAFAQNQHKESAKAPVVAPAPKKQTPIKVTVSVSTKKPLWVDKGSYQRTAMYPELPKLGSKADIVIIDPAKVNMCWVCGTKEPAIGLGCIPKDDREKSLLAFSGGFQYKHDLCGAVQDGKIIRPLRKNVGTIVIYQDGTVGIGKWGRDYCSVNPKMRDVRQGLLLVDNGKFNDKGNFNVFALGNKVYVFRTAFGLTRDGKLMYAGGNNLSAKGLANVMIQIGCMKAVCLDMNYGNGTCGIITHDKNSIRITRLTPQFAEPGRFLGKNNRDFFYLAKKDQTAR